jgi:hypothetical protein
VPAKQVPNLSTTETAQPDPTAKKWKKRVNKKQYVVDEKNLCWVLKRMKAVVDMSQKKIDKGYVSGAIKFKRLFEGKYARFSAKSKAVITALSIAAAGASDYGVQSVIFSTLKAVGDEMGIRQDSGILSFSISCPHHVGTSTFSTGVLKSCPF